MGQGCVVACYCLSERQEVWAIQPRLHQPFCSNGASSLSLTSTVRVHLDLLIGLDIYLLLGAVGVLLSKCALWAQKWCSNCTSTPDPKKTEVAQLLTQLWFWIGVHISYIINCNYGTSRIYNLLKIVFFNCIRTPEHKKVLFYFISKKNTSTNPKSSSWSSYFKQWQNIIRNLIKKKKKKKGTEKEQACSSINYYVSLLYLYTISNTSMYMD